MTTNTQTLDGCLARYARRLHAAFGEQHHVASPLGAWLLLALAAGPASASSSHAPRGDAT